MNEFIAKNKRLLKFYYIAALIMGWILIVLTTVKTAGIINLWRISRYTVVITSIALQLVFGQIILGILLLAVAQFIRFLTSHSYEPGRLLRYIDKLIYLYAIGKVAQMIFLYIRLETQAENAGSHFSVWGSFSIYAVPAIAWVLILVGLGLILKRSIPVIEESKTLV